MLNLIIKAGRVIATLIITIICVFISILITSIVHYISGGDIRISNLIASIAAPLVIAPTVVWIIISLIIKIHKLERNLYVLATYDSLTSLFNRRAFLSALETLLNLIKRTKSNFALLYLDIDFFKKINDEFGHQIGDVVLQEVSTVLRNTIRKSDIIGRFGGEEFIIGLANTNLQKGMLVAEKLRKAVLLNIINIDEGKKIKITISIGVSIYNYQDDIDIPELLNKADKALYSSKESGRNKVSACQ